MSEASELYEYEMNRLKEQLATVTAERDKEQNLKNLYHGELIQTVEQRNALSAELTKLRSESEPVGYANEFSITTGTFICQNKWSPSETVPVYLHPLAPIRSESDPVGFTHKNYEEAYKHYGGQTTIVKTATDDWNIPLYLHPQAEVVTYIQPTGKVLVDAERYRYSRDVMMKSMPEIKTLEEYDSLVDKAMITASKER